MSLKYLNIQPDISFADLISIFNYETTLEMNKNEMNNKLVFNKNKSTRIEKLSKSVNHHNK